VLRQAETEDLGDALAHPLLLPLECGRVERRDHDDAQLRLGARSARERESE
jgi:hypothetical protein